ncbi:MAG TPA: thioredoxin domain-containing protein [Patescibacteria group bacterium]|nr:thioredoxin domain-containing protein [Patescibacteria group bacterium]
MSFNHLGQETSPYLLQHRNNPVHWRAWGPEALAEAKTSGRPILLSVGYAACHWCHVMAHESFENADTAALMNSLFIPIKVDREERPDIDTIYQSALSMLGQQGGWPLTMFLTPTAEPFWGGTYFPPQPRYGRPGFREVLSGVADACRTAPDKIAGNVSVLRDALAKSSRPLAGGGIDMDLLDRAARRLIRAVDPVNGGLNGAPKFPQMSLFGLMWRGAMRNDDAELRNAVTLTLDRMSQGGIYDHLGGGFSRYSTDAEWLVPHFEKMLYDNAQLIEMLTLVWQQTRKPLYAARVAETVGWLLREMLAEGDAFAATLDADSEGEEGRFYVWHTAEIEEALPAHLRETFEAAYDVTLDGNWEGRTVLNRNNGYVVADAETEAQLAEARAILFELRRHRVAPDRDDKVLADWNGMMIAALANAGFVFDRPDWLIAARRAFDAVCRLLGDGDRLTHSYRAGRRQAEAMLDDYAQMARAALMLFELSGEATYLTQAQGWVAVLDAHYWDAEADGYFFTADDAEGLILRSKLSHDNATPAGNGVMIEVLARLYHLTGDDAYRQRAEDSVTAFSGDLDSSFPNMASLLNGWNLLSAAVQVVVVGHPGEAGRDAMLRAVAQSCLPNRVLTVLTPGQTLPPDHPAAGKVSDMGHAVAYLCSGSVCTPPLSDATALRQALATR